MSRILLLSGGTGVGTSSISLRVAQETGFDYIDRTDSVREVLRSLVAKGVNPALFKSTFDAGVTENYYDKSSEVKRAEIIRGYKTQADAVQVGISALVRRTLKEGKSGIIEGVHLRPGLNLQLFGDQVSEVTLYLPYEEMHRERFSSRSDESPERDAGRYLSHFTEIRWIHNYLVSRASKQKISLVDNSGSIEDSVKRVVNLL